MNKGKPPNAHLEKRAREVKGVFGLIKGALFDPDFFDNASHRDDEVVIGTRETECKTCEDSGLVGAPGAQVPCPLRCKASDPFQKDGR